MENKVRARETPTARQWEMKAGEMKWTNGAGAKTATNLNENKHTQHEAMQKKKLNEKQK